MQRALKITDLYFFHYFLFCDDIVIKTGGNEIKNMKKRRQRNEANSLC